jgi:hypothetical protein
VTILHFRAVIDGVDTSRRTLDLDASSFLSFLSFPTFSFIYVHVRELAVEARDAGKRANPGARARVRARKRGTRLKIDGRRYDGAFVRLQRARAIHAMPTTVTSGRVSTSSSPYRLVPAGTGLLRRNRPTLGTR